MAGTTTAFCTSAKAELLQAGHCFNATVTPTGNTHSNTFVDNVSSITGLAVGMAVSGSGIPASTFIAAINSASTLTLSIAATTSLTGTALTIAGDIFKMALIKVGPAGTYGAASTNYTNITGNSDEVSGTGYTATGTTLTNVTPTTSGTTALTDFSPDPNWTSASFSATACMIYNTSARQGTAGRSISLHDFGGTQTVTSGTFTVVLPTADASNAILRIA
jgi:hypothetical protein